MSNFPSTRLLSLSSTFRAPCGTGVVAGQVAAAVAPQREGLPWFCHDGSRNDAMGGPAGSILNRASSPRFPWSMVGAGVMPGLSEPANHTGQDGWLSLRSYDEGTTCTVTISVSWYLWCRTEDA